MRAIALGQAFRRVGGVASLCAASCPAALASRAEAAGLVVVRVPEDGDAAARETAARARAIGASWVVVDGYHLGVPARARLRALGLRVLSVDDHGFAGAEEADAILDQNLGATADAYASRSPDTMLLLGPSYALLREEFVAAAPPVRAIGDGPPHRVLLTFGGTDPANATSLAIELALGTCPSRQVVLEAVLPALERVLAGFLAGGFAAIRAGYERHSAVIGRTLTIDGAAVVGAGFDDDGALRVRPEAGGASWRVESEDVWLRGP